MLRTVVLLFTLAGLASAWGMEANARRGRSVFVEQKCAGCHPTSGTGEGTAETFERQAGRDYTPVEMASRMWNHAPVMWAAIRGAGLETPALTESQAADLFAFFYAGHFFERRGDGEHGRRVFAGKCARCHSEEGPGRPVRTWDLPSDSVELVQRLWNHAPEMNRVMVDRKRKWPELTSSDLSDLLAYVQNLPGNRTKERVFSFPTGTGGRALLVSKGCVSCHNGYAALEKRLADHTITDVAASMWNHAPVMRDKAAELSLDEMREILAYVWSTDFFRSRGIVSKGKKVFEERCSMCHDQVGTNAPVLKAINRPYTAITMVSVLWSHGPRMLQELQRQGSGWPELSESEMENVIAFLDFRLKIKKSPGSSRSTDPADLEFPTATQDALEQQPGFDGALQQNQTGGKQFAQGR